MEILELPGYTEEEKVHIANRFLIPRQVKEHGIALGEQIEFTDEALHDLIHHYTREAGVRNLEREIATLVRKQARRLAEGKTEKLVVTVDVIREALGIPKYRLEKEVEERVSKPGVSVGLVWTPVGGDIVFIEASKMRGGKPFTMTGHRGEVMQESMRCCSHMGACELQSATALIRTSSASSTCTFTFLRVRFRKTGRRRASRWSRRWSAC